MQTAREILDAQFLEMRWRCLSLAADFDRLEKTPDGDQLINSDSRLKDLRAALQIVAGSEANRAERVQMLFSDPST